MLYHLVLVGGDGRMFVAVDQAWKWAECILTWLDRGEWVMMSHVISYCSLGGSKHHIRVGEQSGLRYWGQSQASEPLA